MRLTTSFLVTILVAIPLSAKLFRIEPPAPTSGTSVHVVVAGSDPNGCRPQLDHIDRTGSRVTLVYRNNTCILTPLPWSDDVNAGILPAGMHTIAVAMIDGTTLDSYDLWVADDDPPLRLTPRAVPAGAIEQVEITSKSAFANPVVMFGETAVPPQFVTVLDPHTFLVTTLPHDPGVVDVTVQDASTSITATGAFRFVDSNAPPDPAIYERVLLPVVFNGFGAYGTAWRTDVEILNTNAIVFDWADSARPFYSFNCQIQPPCPGSIEPGRTASVFDPLTKASTGVILFPERRAGARLRFGYRMWEMNQDVLGLSSGTELPVVHERYFRTGKLELASVPVDHQARMTLRIYGPDSYPMAVLIRVYGNAGNQPVADTSVTLQAPACATDPCDAAVPSFASIADLQQAFPALANVDQIRIEVEPVLPARVWAMVTITNNKTQHVTVVTPQ